jgi:integration host factor subunit alpha
MTGETVTRADIYDAVFREAGLSRSETTIVVDLVFKAMTDALADGKITRIATFGTFIVRTRNARTGRNPQTGSDLPIPPRRAVMFKASRILKQRVNAEPPD